MLAIPVSDRSTIHKESPCHDRAAISKVASMICISEACNLGCRFPWSSFTAGVLFVLLRYCFRQRPEGATELVAAIGRFETRVNQTTLLTKYTNYR